MDDDVVDHIMTNVPLANDEGETSTEIDFADFMTATVDLSPKKFFEYCEKAYTLFFNNNLEEVGIEDITERLCSEKLLEENTIKEFLRQVDEDNSGTIDKGEFYESMITHLGFEGV